MRSILLRFLWVGFTAFGSARWVNLEAVFVRTGILREEDFIRDLAIAQTLPGPGFVNLTALCGMRLGGPKMAAAAITLVLLPGLVTIVAALVWLSTSEPWVARLFHGILIGAVAVLASSFIRQSRRLRGAFAMFVAATALVLIVFGTPMIVAVFGAGAMGVVRYRFARQTLP